jgi:GGDEF domain-containing protein
MVRFVGDLMELVTSNIRKSPTEAAEPLQGVLDPETGLPNRATFEEVLDFELQRADEAADGLLVLCLEVAVPEWFSDDLVRAVHERTAEALQEPLRRSDVVARLPPDRYLVLVPAAAAGAGLVLELCSRFGAALRGGTSDRSALPTHSTRRTCVRRRGDPSRPDGRCG